MEVDAGMAPSCGSRRCKRPRSSNARPFSGGAYQSEESLDEARPWRRFEYRFRSVHNEGIEKADASMGLKAGCQMRRKQK
jgi:hypothetical protein